MIAKLITYGEDRSEALVRMRRALSEYTHHGLEDQHPVPHQSTQ